MFNKIKNELRQGKILMKFSSLEMSGQALEMLVPLIIAFVFSPMLFGSYSLSKMIIFFFTSLLIFSSQAPFIVYANQEKVKTGKINKSFSIQLLFIFFALIFFLLLSVIFNSFILDFAQISNAELFFMMLAFVGIATKAFLTNLLLALDKKIKSALVNLLFGIFSLILIIILYFLNIINLQTIFFIYFLAGIFVLIVSIRSIDLHILLPFSFDKKQFKEMFDFTKWQIAGLTAVYFINWGDNIILRFFVSMEEIGIYNLAYQIFKGLISLIYTLNIYFLPFISQNINNKEKIKNYLYKKRPKLALLGALSIIIIFLVMPFLFHLIYPTYIEAIPILWILLIGTLFVLYYVFYVPLLNSLKKYKFYQTSTIIQIIINLLLDIILIPIMGILGAAIATILAYFCKMILIETYIIFKYPQYSIFNWKNLYI